MKNELGNERYADYSTELLLKAYREGPSRILKSIEDLSLEDLKARPFERKWSIFEIALHLADAEIIGSCRIRQALSNHPGPFPFYDQDQWSIDLQYATQSQENLLENLSLFSSLRKTTSNLFSQCTEQDWAKTGIHPERGEMSVRSLLELYADHSERHLEQILVRRELLKKPILIDLLLTVRLY